MTIEQALELLNQVCAAYRGSLQEHQQLQKALAEVNGKLLKDDMALNMKTPTKKKEKK